MNAGAVLRGPSRAGALFCVDFKRRDAIMRVFAPVVSVGSLLALLAGTACAQVTFTPLGFSGGSIAESYSMGHFCRRRDDRRREPRRPPAGSNPRRTRSRVGSRVLLGFLNNSNPSSVANAVNGDGSVAVGFSRYDNFGVFFEAFRRSGGVISNLGDLPTGPTISNSLATSADGSVVVGYGTTAEGTGSQVGFRGERAAWG